MTRRHSSSTTLLTVGLVAVITLVFLAASADAVRVVSKNAPPTPSAEALAATDPSVKAAKQSAMIKKMRKRLAKDMPPDFSKMKSVKELLRDRFEESRLRKLDQENWEKFGKDHQVIVEERAARMKPTADPNKPACKDCHYLPPEPVDPRIKIEDIPVPFTRGPISYVDESQLSNKDDDA